MLTNNSSDFFCKCCANANYISNGYNVIVDKRHAQFWYSNDHARYTNDYARYTDNH